MQIDEETLLGQLLTDSSFFHELAIGEECFLRSQTKSVYKAIRQCIDMGVKPDLISVRDRDQNIDPAYIAQLTDLIPSASNWRYFENKIKDAWQRYTLDKFSVELKEKAQRGDIDQLKSRLQEVYIRLSMDYGKEKIERIDETLGDYAELVKKRMDSKGLLEGIPTGFEKLDSFIQGFKDRRLYYIGARPSQGKTALMLNMAVHVAIKQNIPAGIISIESATQELQNRVVSSIGKIDNKKLDTGFMTRGHMYAFQDALTVVKNKPLYIYDKANLDISQVRSIARVMRSAYGIKVLFIDYLQLIRNENKRLDKVSIVGESSKAMKEMARELNMPIVCLAQLGRDADSKRPGLGDFQWASQIEQDADVAMLIYQKKSDEDLSIKLLVEKNRDGQKGDIDLYYKGEHFQFGELERGQQ